MKNWLLIWTHQFMPLIQQQLIYACLYFHGQNFDVRKALLKSIRNSNCVDRSPFSFTSPMGRRMTSTGLIAWSTRRVHFMSSIVDTLISRDFIIYTSVGHFLSHARKLTCDIMFVFLKASKKILASSVIKLFDLQIPLISQHSMSQSYISSAGRLNYSSSGLNKTFASKLFSVEIRTQLEHKFGQQSQFTRYCSSFVNTSERI